MVDCWAAAAFGQVLNGCEPGRYRREPPPRPAIVQKYSPPKSRAALPSINYLYAPVQAQRDDRTARSYRAPEKKLARTECTVPPRIAVSGYVVVVFRDFAPRTQCAAAYHDGVLMTYPDGSPLVGYASTGMRGRETETPLTEVKDGPQFVEWAKIDHESNEFDAPMPFAMFFNSRRGIAFHQGVTSSERLSHGCVRLPRELVSTIWAVLEHIVGRKLYSYKFKATDEKLQVIVTTDEIKFVEDWAVSSVARTDPLPVPAVVPKE